MLFLALNGKIMRFSAEILKFPKDCEVFGVFGQKDCEVFGRNVMFL